MRRINFSVAFGCLVVIVAFMLVTPANARAKEKPRLSVAVMAFESMQPMAGRDVAQLLAARLSHKPGIVLVDRMSLRRTLQEVELSMTGLVAPNSTVRSGQLVGAKLMIGGRVFVIDDHTYITAHIIGTETSLEDSVLVDAPIGADFKKLVDKLATKVIEDIHSRGKKLIASSQGTSNMWQLREKLAHRSHLPRVALSVSEEHFDQPTIAGDTPFGSSVQNEMRDTFLELGVPIAAPDAAGPVSKKSGLILSGHAFSERAVRVGALVTVSAWGEISVTDGKTGEVLFAGKDIARTADLSANLAAEKAREEVGRALAIRVAERLADGSGRALSGNN